MATNGEVELKVPALGAVRLAGRDLLLAATLMVLGVGAVAVQVYTLRQWRDSLRADITRGFELHTSAARERAELMAAIRLQKCSDVLSLEGKR